LDLLNFPLWPSLLWSFWRWKATEQECLKASAQQTLSFPYGSPIQLGVSILHSRSSSILYRTRSVCVCVCALG
jgi:hypothetical protein